MPVISAGEIADYVSGHYSGPRECSITAVASLAEATVHQLSFLTNRRYTRQLTRTKASAVLVPLATEGDDERWIRVADPYFAMSTVVSRWFDVRPRFCGTSPRASIAPSAKLGENAAVGPFAMIGDNAVIGNNVTIFENVSIGVGCTLGDDSVAHPNVVIYDGVQIGRRCIIHAGAVIGSDGYGFATHGGKHYKIAQIGSVRIADDVEIGAGTTIDRAALGETVIGEGTKIDNLVHIAHNVKIGKHCLLVAQSGIAGSTELGDYVSVAGQAGISGHLKIGNRVQVAGGSAVTHDIPDGTKVMGFPAIPFREFARQQAALKRLVQKQNSRASSR
jgi:UDP-3-O-[3-hydroxymyristoyl] glucosamine N-acyltransferase